MMMKKEEMFIHRVGEVQTIEDGAAAAGIGASAVIFCLIFDSLMTSVELLSTHGKGKKQKNTTTK